MTPATFFKHFDTLADAPNAVAKLRELILQMAVMGKLVAQDPKDEPGPAVRDRRAVQTDGLPCLPVHWHYANPDEISADVPHAFTIGPFGSNLVRSDYRDGGVPLVFVRDIRSETFGGSGTRFVDPAKAQELSAHMVQGGDVLITKMGDPPGDTAIYPKDRPPAIITADCIKLTPDKSVASAEYLRYAIRSNLVAEQIAGITMGIAHQKVSLKRLRSVRIPLPPRAEQDRIVAKVDELMRLCEELESRLQRQQESRQRLSAASLDRLLSAREPAEFADHWQRICGHFDLLYDAPETIGQLRQAILQLAFEGRLSGRSRDDGPIASLLAEVKSARERLVADRTVRGGDESTPVADDEVPFPAPDNWQWVRFGELAHIVGGVTLGRKLEGKQLTAYPYLRVANVQRGFVDLSTVKEIEIPSHELEKYRLESGDVLLTEGGDWDKLGRSAVWQGEIADCLHQNHIFRARPVAPGVRSQWISLFTNSPVGRRYFQDASKQTTNLATINMTQLRNCPIPLPCTAAQDRTLRRVDHLMSLCDALEAKLQQSQADSQRLLAAAVHQLLNGGA